MTLASLTRILKNDQTSGVPTTRHQGYLDSPLAMVLHRNDLFVILDDDLRAVLGFTADAAQVQIFKDLKITSMAEQGHLMFKILKHMIVRRTPSSKLNGIMIGSTLPSVQQMVFECEFTPLEQKHHNAAMADESIKLFARSKNKDAVVFNTIKDLNQSCSASQFVFKYVLTYMQDAPIMAYHYQQ